MNASPFVSRHIGTDSEQQQQMLAQLSLNSCQELIDRTMPVNIRLQQDIALPTAIAEHEYAAHIASIANMNQPLRTLIGMGCYGSATPAVVQRNIFENPAWYTSYTPYQAEISQGRLEALLNFQTMIRSLTGMEMSNCSLLCEATAAAEAARTMYELRSKQLLRQKANILLVDRNVFPSTLAAVRTRCRALGIDCIVTNIERCECFDRCFGAIVQYPAADGEIRNYAWLARELHDVGALLTAVCDVMALTILKEPSSWGADIAVGTTQRFGCPIGFGGPHAAFMAGRKEYVRQMPGRIIGASKDRMGNRALRMALQTREQHIKRERATSNICTAQALMAIMAGMYAMHHGAAGIRAIACRIHALACLFAKKMTEHGKQLAASWFFDTIEVQNIDAAMLKVKAQAAGYNLFYPSKDRVRLSFDEFSNLHEVIDLLNVFNIYVEEKEFLQQADAIAQKVESSLKNAQQEYLMEQQSAATAATIVVDAQQMPSSNDGMPVYEADFDQRLAIRSMLRQTDILVEDIFNKYRSETALMRYIKQLEGRDISLMQAMIPLGSCTMKLNAAALMLPLSNAGFTNVHPYVPREQALGYHVLIERLSGYLSAITGFPAVSMQPGSGASAEYAGLMMIRRYLHEHGGRERNIALIPASAHGTNAASASMAGMQVMEVACDQRGSICIKDISSKLRDHGEQIACMMLTYPSTHGVFEEDVVEIISMVHAAGGMVYMDGANMNALVGYATPAAMDADVCHLNLHKTFAMPHGGGGPGVGVVCAKEKLAQYLPLTFSPDKMYDGEDFVSAAHPWGNAMLLPITYGYIRMLGGDGLKRATAAAILNANYIAKKLQPAYNIVYTGESGFVGHECIVDCRNFSRDYGVGAMDIARRLMDYGFHAPTVSFPVHDTLMIEPTESENKDELDRFVAAMLAIKDECERIAAGMWSKTDNPLVNAPHTAAEVAGEWEHAYSRECAVFPLAYLRESKFFPFVSKIDHGYGDRHLVEK